MELTLDAVAKDAFRREFFYRCFTNREVQALELRFALLYRIRQYKRLVGRRDLLPRAAKDIVASYLQQVESTNQLLLPLSAEPLRTRVINAVEGDYCPLDLFNGIETLVYEHMTREVFPQFLHSQEYTKLCDALRSRRQVPLAQVLVDTRRTQFLMNFLSKEYSGEEGNLLFWVHVQTRFLPLIQTTLFSVALFEEVQRQVRHVFNRFLVGEREVEKNGATQVPEAVRRATLQQIMKLQSEPFSPPRYANLFRAAQDCVWEWLQTVYPKFYASSLYVMLVVEMEDIESDQQLRRLSEYVLASETKCVAGLQESPNEVMTSKCDAHLKAKTVLVPIKVSPFNPLWIQETECKRCHYNRVLAIEELAQLGINSLSIASTISSNTPCTDQVVFELFCSGNQQEVAAQMHPTYLNHWCMNMMEPASDTILSPSGRPTKPAVPKPSSHDFVLPLDEPSETTNSRYLYGVCLTLWRQKSAQEKPHTPNVNDLTTRTADAAVGELVATAQFYKQVFTVLTTELKHKKSRRLLLQLASKKSDDLTADTITQSVTSIFNCASNVYQLLCPRYSGFYLQPHLRTVDISLSSVFKEISAQTVINILASILVGRSIIVVSNRSSALVSVIEAIRELLKPFEWTHIYLPFCSVLMSTKLRDIGLFLDSNISPFLLGYEGMLSLSKKDSGIDQRYRIRESCDFSLSCLENVNTEYITQGNSFYTTHKVSLSLQAPLTAGRYEYPPELLQTTAIVIDIDSDDTYVPERAEIPELPQAIVRELEINLNLALRSSRISQADSYLFNSSRSRSPLQEMLEKAKVEGTNAEIAVNTNTPSLDDQVRLAFLWFLEALLGDVVYYFCCLRQAFAIDNQSTSAEVDKFLLFEIDSFLDAHTELGCRDFFRQCFHTELFRKYLLDQHMRFTFKSVSNDLGFIEHTEPHQELLPDEFI
ncbi:putative cDENN domain, RGS domain, RGS domain superfamily, tripartite DENN domain-containing protein [Plasmopara halstedii]